MVKKFKWTRRAALAVLASIAAAAVLWSISRAWYPTQAQRDALASMQMPEAPQGRNAFAALWTLNRAVPVAEMRQVIRRDAARIAALPQFPDKDAPGFISAAEEYPNLAPSPEDRAMFCSPERENCVEKVAGDTATYRALVERNRRLLDRIDALADYDYVRQRLPWNLTASILVPNGAAQSTTRNALWFVEGRIDEALAASCRGIDTWRRLGASSDTLILRLSANAFAIKHHGKVLADMLAELPSDHPLPAVCEPALAPPPPDELSLCPAMRGEFELITETTGPMLEEINQQNWWSPLHFFLLYDTEATKAAQAQNFVPMCAERELERIAADDPEIEQSGASGRLRFACLGNFAGCFIGMNTAPAYARYRIRMQDFGAQIKLLATLAWLRENADEKSSLEDLLSSRPQSMKSPTRRITVAEDGSTLRMRMFNDYHGEYWSIPLPRTLRE